MSGTSQFNQTNNAGQGWKVFNWGGGSNTTDTGCQYSFTLVDEVTVPTAIKPAQQPQTDPQNTYDLSGRLLLAPAKGIYIQNGEKRIR